MVSNYRYKIIRTAREVNRNLALAGLWVCGALQAGTHTGAAVCGQCHPAELREQSASGHAHALHAAAEHPLAAKFVPEGMLERTPLIGFQFSLRSRDFRVRVFDARSVLDIPIEWAFGAGEQTVTFASRIDRDWWVEHYFSYYAATGRMGVTPGQQGRPAKALREAAGLIYKALDAREGIVRCFRCHSTGPIDTSRGTIEPAETGVRCEACHAEGGAHAQAGDPKLIRNPKRMTAAQLNEFCGECHRPPAARGTQIDWNFAWNVRHQPVYLGQSACFRKSQGALSCLTCHRPHAALERDAAYYNRVCASCHPAAHTDAAMYNCTDCHMPRVSPQPALRFTNHWIGIYGEGARLKPARPS
jgi:hypothetical protein